MHTDRRSLLVLVQTCTLVFAALAPSVHAQTSAWPERPIRVVALFAPGGNVDVVARLAAQGLERELKQTVIVENLAGASGAIGALKVAKAEPDGYTLLANASIHVILPSVRSNLGYDVLKDFVPLAQLTEVPLVLLIGGTIPAKNHPTFVDWAKAQRGGIDYSTFIGSAGHLASELWKEQSGVKVNAIPYKVAGRIHFTFDALFAATGMLQSGKLRALGITSATRSPMVPDVPTFAELGFPGIDASTWHGLWAPRGTPPAIVERLGSALVRVSQSPEFQDRVRALGGRVVGSTPADFASFTARERERWGGLLTRAGIKPE
jgi:tripartite-type tricarboxylate transporter receptor subunit TctC